MHPVDDFFNELDQVLKSDKFQNCSYPVFRGHSKTDFKLLPTLQRDYEKTGKDLETLENNLYCDFRSLVGPRVNFNSSWETLFAMRHQGIPTRLLDWTENFGTALFFALDSPELENPHIWVLNPYSLNKVSCGSEVLLNPEEDIKIPYHESYAILCNDPNLAIHDYPIAIYPKRTNDRIFAQRGLFTIHGRVNKPIDEIFPEFVQRIEIQESLTKKLKDLLLNFGINKYSVYPDLKGLCDYLKDSYGY